MKRFLLGLMAMIISVISFAAAPYHIGMVSGTVSQSEDSLRACEEAVRIYGDVANGGMVKHITYPDNFMQEQETVISQIAALADDPEMKLIVVAEAIPGTVEACRRIKEKRPDMVIILNTAHEDPKVVSEVADLQTRADSITRGYLLVLAAHKLGADTFCHVSFPRHLSYEHMSRRRNVMRWTCEQLGMKYVDETAPDPVSDVGVAGAQQYLLEQMPHWIEKYGKKTAFYCTNDAHTEPMLKRIAELGGLFVEPDTPSPTMGYPGAFGIKFTDEEKGNWPKILKKVEDTVVKAGGANRFGAWAWSYTFASTLGLVKHGMNVVEGKTADIKDMGALMTALKESTAGTGWNGGPWIEPDGTELDNFIMLYQDTYVFGKGFMNMTAEKVPQEIYSIKR